MNPVSKAVAKYAAILLLPALLIAGCEQQNKQQNHQQNNTRAQEQFAGKSGGRVRLRTVCADDIQKYCSNADRKRRCLKENIDKLSDACKAAVGQRGGRKARDNNGSENGGGNDD